MSSLVLTGVLASGAAAAEATPRDEAATVENATLAPEVGAASVTEDVEETAAGTPVHASVVDEDEPVPAEDTTEEPVSAAPAPEPSPAEPAPAAPTEPAAQPRTEQQTIEKEGTPVREKRESAVQTPQIRNDVEIAAEDPALETPPPRVSVSGQASVDQFYHWSPAAARWEAGNVSGYAEGDWMPHRVDMSNLSPTRHTYVFTYDQTRNGIWAFDDTRAFRIVDGAGSGANGIGSQAGSIVSVGSSTLGSTANDSMVRVTVVFTVPDDGIGDFDLVFDAHIASELDHGAGKGASSIRGSSYHFNSETIDGANSGGKSLPIRTAGVDYATITIVKQTDPADDPNSFPFVLEDSTGTYGGVEFSLADNGTSTYRVAPGEWEITESAASPWSLASALCVRNGTGGAGVIEVQTVESGVAVDVADNNEVTCTFTNTKTIYNDLTVTATAEPSYARDYDWSIKKTASIDRIHSATGGVGFGYEVLAEASAARDHGFSVSGGITVGNRNNVEIAGVILSGSLPGATCTIKTARGSTVTGPVSIPAGGATYSYGCELPGGTTAQSAGTNTMEARWNSADYRGTDGAATATASYDFADTKPTVTDATVIVADDTMDLSGQPGGNVVTPADSPRVFEYSIDWPGVSGECTDYDNTATYTEADGDSGTSTETVTLCLGSDLTATNEVVAGYDRTYLWDIDKEADAATTEVTNSGEATYGYTVAAIPAGAIDSGHTIVGRITIANPNDFGGAITATVSDSVDVGGEAACSLKGPDGAADADPDTGGFQVEVPANTGGGTGVVVLDSLCTFADKPAASGTNTATVTWDGGRTTAPSPFEFTTRDTANGTVKVYGDKVTQAAHPVLLGEAKWNASGVPTEFGYRLAHEGVAGRCLDFTNTAWVELVGANGADRIDPKARETVTLCVEDDLVVAKTAKASFDRTYQWEIDKNASETEVETGPDGGHTFDYTVEAIPDGYRDSGWELEGKITLSNPNTYAEGAITATVKDIADVGAGVRCKVAREHAVIVLPGETKVLNYECDFEKKPDYKGTNTVFVEWDGGKVSARAPVKFRVDDEIDKRVDVYDDMVDLDDAGFLGAARWNADGEAREFEYSLDLEVPGGTCGEFTNTAYIDTEGDGGGDWNGSSAGAFGGKRGSHHGDPTADETVELCSEAPLTVEKDAEADFDRQYFWEIDKTAESEKLETVEGTPATAEYTVTAEPTDYEDSDWTLAGSITVENPNDYKDVVVTVLDRVELGGGAQCTVEDGEDVAIGAGDSETFAYDCEFEEEPEYSGTSTATAEWEAYDGDTARAEGTANIEFELDGETDRNVTVVDDMADPDAEPEVLGTAEWNEDGEPETFAFALELDGTAGTCEGLTNEATIEETEQSASAEVEVCVESALTAEHEAWAGMDRTYRWDIDKTAASGSVMMGAGKKPATYSVTVAPAGLEDSGWTLGGTVTVHNPNDYKTMAAGLDLAHTLGGDGTCAFDTEDSEEIRVGPGELLVVPFGCDFGAEPENAGTSTAMLAWDDAEGSEQSLDADADVVFAPEAEHHGTVTVSDDRADPDGEAMVLGTVDWNPDGTPEVFEYTLDLAARPGTCLDYTNTATLVETGDSDAATVRACGIAAPLQPLPDTTSGEPLPNTGANIQAILWVALALLLSGALALGAGRRRRHQA